MKTSTCSKTTRKKMTQLNTIISAPPIDSPKNIPTTVPPLIPSTILTPIPNSPQPSIGLPTLGMLGHGI